MEILSDKGGAEVTGASVLSAPEAERLVEALRTFSIEEVGSPEWVRQHATLERLNLQAHYNASTNSDPFVLEALITFGKLKVVVHELVLVEAWREFVFPRIVDKVASAHSMRVYFILYQETLLFNLLEVLLYHLTAIEALEEDALDLVDVCARKMTLLNARDPSVQPVVYDSASDEMAAEKDLTTAQNLHQSARRLGFRSCVSAVACARYIAEHASKAPVSVLARVLDTHDYMVQFVALLENPPWVRRTKHGKWQKFWDLKWREVPPRDLLLLTRNEGQVWIGLYNIMCDPEVAKRYHLNTHRKDAVMRIRKYMNELLLDQLPVLRHVQRYLDELAIMQPPEPTALRSLVVEQVPHMRQEVCAVSGGWEQLGRELLHSRFGDGARVSNEDLRSLADVYTLDAYEGDGAGAGAPDAI